MSNIIYLDNAATTRISPAAREAMEPYLDSLYGNASSLYSLGRESAKALLTSRRSIAEALNCDPREIYFTSGGSEANNWAIKGTARLMEKQGKRHIISSEFEHHAVLHVLQSLEKNGFEVTYLPVYEKGAVRVADLEKAIRPDSALVTIMHVNNEIGTIQPVSDIGAVCKERGILFHSDAVQALGNVPIDIQKLNADFLSLSGHKIHAVKGVGALYISKKIRFAPYIEGGAQESGLRAGTENIAGIAGFAKAAQEAADGVEEKNAKLLPLCDKLYRGIMKLEKVHLNGCYEQRVVNNLNFSFEGIEGESLLLMLDMAGICCSSGSACTSSSLDPSHVLLALGLPHEVAHGSLRISMSRYTTEAEIDRLLEVLPGVVGKLRAMSPLWENIMKNERK
ncbi:MAG: IscS subfamily cysteine desulfurase [Oscillospiraceae bacterium]|nr:IscS subfamily cysteine desulfurase [Oscillospiraceae bacterium]